MEENPENKIEKATSVQFNSQTVIAFIRLLASLAAGVAAAFGWTLDIDLWQNIVISAAAIGVFVYFSWWKNNNVTEAAQEAQLLLDEIKQNDKRPDATVGGTE